MTKTPEELAEEYERFNWCVNGLKSAFLAGYEAAKDEDKAKMQEVEANWKFCCEDKARLLNELAAAERAKDQLADADKVMPQWISVKERLPEIGQRVLIYNPLEYVSIVMADYYNVTRPFFDYITLDDIHLTIYPDEEKQLYWTPLPKPPEEK